MSPVPQFNINRDVSVKIYDNTIDRDSDVLLYQGSFYPHITYVGGNNPNPVGSVDIDTSYIAYYDGQITYDNLMHKTGRLVELYDILVQKKIMNPVQQQRIYSHVFKTVADAQAFVNNDTSYFISGICVKPKNTVEEDARFVALHDIPNMGRYGSWGGDLENNSYRDGLLKPMDTFATVYSFTMQHNAIKGTHDGFGIYYELNETDSFVYVYPCPCDEDGNLLTTYNVVPIINKSNINNTLNMQTQRVVQYTGIMLSDNIDEGKNSSYIDSGAHCNSYYYYVTGYQANYIQPSWRLNRRFNQDATLSFYYDSETDTYPSFLNPLTQYDGLYNTYCTIRTIYNLQNSLENFTHPGLGVNQLFSIDMPNNDNAFIMTSEYSAHDYTTWPEITSSFSTFENNINLLYIPSVGEFSFLMARLAKINDIIDEIGADPIHPENIYITSNECSDNGVYAVWPYNGALMNVYKRDLLHIRPFIHVGTNIVGHTPQLQTQNLSL